MCPSGPTTFAFGFKVCFPSNCIIWSMLYLHYTCLVPCLIALFSFFVVWTIDYTGNQLIIHVVVMEDISPAIEMPVPLMLEDCLHCKSLLLNKGGLLPRVLFTSNIADMHELIMLNLCRIAWKALMRLSLPKAFSICYYILQYPLILLAGIISPDQNAGVQCSVSITFIACIWY